MAPTSPLANRYARAILAPALEQGAADRVAAELGALGCLLREHAAWRAALLSPLTSRAQRLAALTALCGARLHPLSLAGLKLLVARNRLGFLDEIARRLADLLRATRGRLAALLTSARPLDADETAAARARLETIFNCAVDLETAVDPGLLGGITLRAGDRLLDGSCRGGLQALQAAWQN